MKENANYEVDPKLLLLLYDKIDIESCQTVKNVEDKILMWLLENDIPKNIRSKEGGKTSLFMAKQELCAPWITKISKYIIRIRGKSN